MVTEIKDRNEFTRLDEYKPTLIYEDLESMDQLYIKSGIKYLPTSAGTVCTLQQPYYDVEKISQELLEYKKMQVAIRYEIVEEEHITFFPRQKLKSSNVLKVNDRAEIHILDDHLEETTEILELKRPLTVKSGCFLQYVETTFWRWILVMLKNLLERKILL